MQEFKNTPAGHWVILAMLPETSRKDADKRAGWYQAHYDADDPDCRLPRVRTVIRPVILASGTRGKNAPTRAFLVVAMRWQSDL